MSEEEYRQFALGDGSGQWELVDGRLREKPGMSVMHGHVIDQLLRFLFNNLDRSENHIRANHARLRCSAETYSIPDIAIIPTPYVLTLLARPEETLDAYPQAPTFGSRSLVSGDWAV